MPSPNPARMASTAMFSSSCGTTRSMPKTTSSPASLRPISEYGKFSGAVMNAITKSGTNGFHGDVFEFLRNDALDAQNYFFSGQPKTELRQHQFGFTAGGPFWKDKLFWFTDYQGTRI